MTLVRPSSMFLKCLNVMARPATMAGRYNRSRQFNLGLGTVIAILKLPTKHAKTHEKMNEISFVELSCHFVCLVGERNNRCYDENVH